MNPSATIHIAQSLKLQPDGLRLTGIGLEVLSQSETFRLRLKNQ